MSYLGNGISKDLTAAAPRMIVSSESLNRKLIITITSRAPSTKVRKTLKPWKHIRGLVKSLATATAIAVALWFSYFAARVLMRAVKRRRYRRQAGI